MTALACALADASVDVTEAMSVVVAAVLAEASEVSLAMEASLPTTAFDNEDMELNKLVTELSTELIDCSRLEMVDEWSTISFVMDDRLIDDVETVC